MKLLVLLIFLGQTLREAQTVSNLLAADLNGDRLPDLITQTAQGYGVYLNRGRLRFEAVDTIQGIGVGEPGGCALADMNGDGLIDLISGSHDSYRIAVLLGDGKGGFLEAANSPLKMSAGACQVKIAGINQDRFPDLLVASTDDRGPVLLVALGKRKGDFEVVQSAEAQDHKIRFAQLELTDWDGDGNLDALVGPGHDGRPHVLLGDGKGHFRRSPKALPGRGRTWQFQVSNRMIVAAAGDHADVIRGEKVRRIEAGAATWNLVVADFDGNGKPDVAAASGVEVRVHSLDGFIDLGGRLETDRDGIHLAKLHHEFD